MNRRLLKIIITSIVVWLTGCAKANDDITNPDVMTSFRSIAQWAVTVGSGTAHLQNPQSLHLSPQNEVYIADYANDRIQVFNTTGTQIRSVGSRGTDVGQMIGPRGVAVDSLGNILVSDYGNSRVLFFEKNGTGFTNTLTFNDFNGTALNQPYGVATYEEFVPQITGDFYIVDTGNARLIRCDRSGTFVWSYGTEGTGTTQLYLPTDVGVSTNGQNIYISDTGNNRIVQIDRTGARIRSWSDGGESHISLNGSVGIHVDYAGHVYVADQYNHRIVKYSSEGVVLGYYTFTTDVYPVDVVADHRGFVYVADFVNSTIHVLAEYH